ncbi:MAG: hypothetical protein Ct9H300mP12_01880 [Acidimicrobiales bacterium]|nr:MAG: hypothetical protein Ct9H300mP12_01880 [Acidimicrobiales bacterium]
MAENEARGLSIDAVPSPPTTPCLRPLPLADHYRWPTTTAEPTTPLADHPAGRPPLLCRPHRASAQHHRGDVRWSGRQVVAQLLGQPCIPDGDLSDCGPEVDALVRASSTRTHSGICRGDWSEGGLSIEHMFDTVERWVPGSRTTGLPYAELHCHSHFSFLEAHRHPKNWWPRRCAWG